MRNTRKRLKVTRIYMSVDDEDEVVLAWLASN